jgi:hypothetical protein
MHAGRPHLPSSSKNTSPTFPPTHNPLQCLALFCRENEEAQPVPVPSENGTMHLASAKLLIIYMLSRLFMVLLFVLYQMKLTLHLKSS